MIFGLVIAMIVLIIAVLIYTLVFVVVEHDNAFLMIVGGFLVLFVVSAVALSWLLPDLSAKSDVNALVSAWVNNGGVVQQTGAGDLPLYGE